MLYLNEQISNDDWIRIPSMNKIQTTKIKKNKRSTPNSKIDRLNLRKINSSSSSSSSSLSSSSSSISTSFSANDKSNKSNNKKVCIYKKSINKSRNFFNSSSDTLSKIAYKKRKLKLNKLVDDLDKSKRSKSEKRASNHDSRYVKRSSSSEINIIVSTRKQKPSTCKVRLKSVENNIILDTQTTTHNINKYNSYGLIPFIPTKCNRPCLPKHLKRAHPLIKPPLKIKLVQLRNNRSRSSPKISVFYSVEFDSPDEFTNNSMLETNNLINRTNKIKYQDNDVNTLCIKTKIKQSKLKKLKDIEPVNSKSLNKLIIGDRPDKIKNYYLSNNTKLINDNHCITNPINNSVQSKPGILKKNLKSIRVNNLSLIPIINNTTSDFNTKTVIDLNKTVEMDKQLTKFNQIKDVDLLETKLKSVDYTDENYQKITRQNRIIFYEDKPISLNEKQISKYEANLPQLPEELKNAIKTLSSAKSPLIRKKLLFNSISKSINQDILENLSVILEEENTHSSKNSSCVNSNAINASNTNSIANNCNYSNKSDCDSVQENLNTTASITKLDDELTYMSEKSITTIAKTELDTFKIDKMSKNESMKKEKLDTNCKTKQIDDDKVKKDEIISNAFKYLISKETEQDLKESLSNLNESSKSKLNELIIKDETSVCKLKAIKF